MIPKSEYFVIDNFFEDPNAVRREIIDYCMQNEPMPYEHYSGQRWGIRRRRMSKYIIDRASKVVGKKLYVAGDPHSLMYQLITEKDGQRNWIHKDPIHPAYRKEYTEAWTGIIYMNKRIPSHLGTTLYEEDDVFEVERNEFGDPPWELRNDPDNLYWIPSVRSEYRFNSMFIFRSDKTYHMGTGGWGTNPENCRITIPVFFVAK